MHPSLKTFLLACPLLLLSLFLATACGGKAAERYTLEELPEEQLVFSFGGGFSGQYQEYMLLPNGQVFHRRKVINELPFRPYTDVDSKEARDLFATYRKLDFAALNYDEPGDMTYTIIHTRGDQSSTLTWGGPNTNPTEELRSYWRRAMQLLGDTEPLPASE